MIATAKSDTEVRDDVVEEIEFDPAVNVSDIMVTVNDGAVRLNGVSDSYAARWAAEEAAYRVSGVRTVVNEIVVDPALLGKPTDAEIATDLRRRLEHDFLAPKGRITVSVADGVVTLSGTVRLHLQVEAALEEARGTSGVRRVVNLLHVDRGSPSPTDIGRDIRRALVRNAQVDADDVHVTADGGNVTLAGTVGSYAARRAAEDAAWRADGTTEVIDNLTIVPA